MVVVFLGFAIGLVMAIFDNYEIYLIGMAIEVASLITCMCVYFIPRLTGMFKKKPEEIPIGLRLVAGRDGGKVRMKGQLKLHDIEL